MVTAFKTIIYIIIISLTCGCADNTSQDKAYLERKAKRQALTESLRKYNKEKPKNQLSEKFQRNLASTFKVTESTKIDNALVGVWRCVISPSTIVNCNNADVSLIRFIEPMYRTWEFKSDGIWNYNSVAKEIKTIHGTTKWKLIENKLITPNTPNDFDQIKWLNANSFRIETSTYDCLLVNAVFERVRMYASDVVSPSPQSEGKKTICVYCHGKKTKTCGYCNGTGRVEHIVQKERWNNITQRPELYNETEIQTCQACNNGQIICNVCTGKGKY
jgi:hypothetical protein